VAQRVSQRLTLAYLLGILTTTGTCVTDLGQGRKRLALNLAYATRHTGTNLYEAGRHGPTFAHIANAPDLNDR
jgi:hypothetical protein